MPDQPFPSIAFLWPALAAASTSGMMSALAGQLAQFGAAVAETQSRRAKWSTANRVALELPCMHLREFCADDSAMPTLICAPFALHRATIADFAPGHSLVRALRGAGLSRICVTDWLSAGPEMRYLSIDNYLADLDVAVDELGGKVDLIGLCQGGWLALLFAARFPQKVRKLVLAGAPVDIRAGESPLSRMAAQTPLAVFEQLVELGGGRILGDRVLGLWGPRAFDSQSVRELLQLPQRLRGPALRLEAEFREWHAATVDLPGTYYLEVVEWLYKQNRLAEGRLVALGRRIDLARVRVPLFLLAARDDDVVAPEQVLATEARVGTAATEIETAIAPCRHLGLFMGARTLRTVWPNIARWMIATPAVPRRSPRSAAPN
ncbi:MAG TPA: alpha/beta fold hydrolase [Xanthobacteraceae bacterium]